jgi:hypothetical protein
MKFSKFLDIVTIIIPFFNEYPVIGLKSLDFADFKKVYEIIADKKHLMSEGIAEIIKINSNMNDRRPITKTE